jgi:hypothetical protein
MKTCPYNTEGLLSHRLFLWAAIKLPPHAKSPVPLNRKAGLEHAAQAAASRRLRV